MPARKGQGQWALGYREPLNPNERAKRDDDGLNVRQRIIDIYQHTGFAGIDPADLRGRLRWYGLYTQRRTGHPRRSHRDPRAGGARGRVLHDAHPHRRRRALGDQLAVIGEICDDLRPRRGRHHRPAERPAALDPDRGRADHLDEARGGRAVDHRGLWRHSASDARLPAGRRRRRLGARRRSGAAIGRRHVPRRSGLLEPAAQVQDVHLGLRAALHEPRDQRCRIRRRRRDRGHARIRPLGRRRAVDQPDVRAADRCLRRAGRGRRGLGRCDASSFATTATAAPATTPG